MNSCHPDPRRMWKVGPGAHFPDQFRKHPRDLGSKFRECQKTLFLQCFWHIFWENEPKIDPQNVPFHWSSPGQMRYPQRGTTKGYPPNGGTPKWGTPQRGGGYPKNDEKIKVLRMEFSIVEILSGLQESIFSLFRRPQLHSREKSKN